MNKIIVLLVVVILMFSLVACSAESKLVNLDYPEANAAKMAESDYSKDIIKNKIAYEELKDLKKIKGYKSDNLKYYVKVLNRVYTSEEMEFMVTGVNAIVENNTDHEKALSGNRDSVIKEIDKSLAPKITFKDKNEINASKDDKGFDYLKKNIKAYSYFDGNIENKVEFTGEFYPNKLGEYEISYKVEDSKGYKSQGTEVVKVVDKMKPQIKVPAFKDLFVGDKFDLMENVTGEDNLDGDITDKIILDDSEFTTEKAGRYKVKYSLTDKAGNTQDVTRSINILPLVQIGETFKINKYEITVSSYKFNRTDSEPQTGWYSYYTADDGQTFLISKVKIKNLDDIKRQPIDIFGDERHMIEAQLIYDGQYEYNDAPHGLDNNWFDTFCSINPLATKTRNLSFEIPIEAKDSDKSLIMKITTYEPSDEVFYIRIR